MASVVGRIHQPRQRHLEGMGHLARVGAQHEAGLAQLGVAAQDDPLDILPLARILVNEVDEGDGVLILSDILGATPANLTLKLLDPGRIEGVTGVSLPMILRALTYRKNEMKILVQKAVSGGRDGVINLHRQ